ncbi:MAG: gliding motility-associated C-terminal domain-containing protein [Crocinitomicaceae bacterium]|nr:gliding motility-associated C-terminal domain-containing protein [Crocinitomicaceae bacterium]MDP4868656.1 gliding motility-associated C-terminal domain-containing protein [Crocinitomicaceae bacterium]MDP5067152.1 gliding motility-associated C-terminal domain-containing protein [Crocinitomicaceae bacterium]
MLKMLRLSVILFLFQQVNAQVLVDSPLYQQLKGSGQLGTVNTEANSSIQLPVAGVKPASYNKANACDCYIAPDSSYTLAMQPNDDGSTGLIPIPFTFNLYGQAYNSLYINNNGNVTFTGPLSTFSATAFPSVGNAIVAPFWADVDTRNGNGQVLYKITPTAVYVNWVDVGYYAFHGDKLNTFQLIITNGSDPVIDGGNVAFCYQNMDWTTGDASQGVNGFGGVPATCGANKGDGLAYFLISRFDHPGNDFDGALGNPDGIDWLDYKSFAFDASNGGNIPPIPEGIASCDTFKICALGDSADFSINFLSPETNQSTTITYSNGGLTTLQQISNTPGNTANIVLRAVGSLATMGTYNITVTATDDNLPTPGVTALTFVVVIDTIVNNLDSAVLVIANSCGAIDLSVSSGPYDSYLWDDFTVMPTSGITTDQIYGVTVSKNGCYKHISDTFDVVNPMPVNLQGPMAFCPPDTAVTLTIPNAPAYSTVSWGLLDPLLNAQYSNILIAGTYTINLLDSAGLCSTDTTFTVFGTAASTIFNDSTICQNTYQVAGTNSPGGTWTSSSPNLTFSSNTALDPLISISTPGVYTVSFTDNVCQQTLSAVLTLPINPGIFDDTALCQLNFQVSGTLSDALGGLWTYTSNNPNASLTFTPGNAALNPSINASESGIFTLTFTDEVCSHTATTTLELYAQPYINLDSLGCNYQEQIQGTLSALGGVWSCPDTSITFSNPTSENPLIICNYAGVFPISYTDNACGVTLTEFIEFPPYVYVQLLDTNICQGSSFAIDPYTLNVPKDSTLTEWTLQSNYNPLTLGTWQDGSTEDPRVISAVGNYIYTISNACYTYTDTASIGFKPCDIIAPNVIVLSSTNGNAAFFVQYSGISEFECIILNRWGNTVYSYTDPASSWNGQTTSGDKVEEGTYFYVIKALYEGGIPIEKHGFVEVKY